MAFKPIPASIIFILIASLAGMPLLRGGYKFYTDILTYHKLPDDYDEIIAYEGEPNEGSIEDIVETDMRREDIDEIKHISEVTTKESPKILYNFNKNKKREAKERFKSKISVLWFYSTVGNLAGVVIIAFHLAALSSAFSSGQNIGPSLVAISATVSGFHMVLRLSTLFDYEFFDHKSELGHQFRETVRDMGLSLFVSLYLIWVAVVSIFFAQDSLGIVIDSLPSADWWLSIAATISFSPLITSLISEIFLRDMVDDSCTEVNYSKEDIEL